MIVFQVPAVVGGTVLIIDRIQSQNFVTGVSGWAVKADGTAEFFNLVSRGSFIGGAVGGKRVEVNGSFVPGGLAFYTGDTSETLAGFIDPNNLAPPSPTTPLQMEISGPRQGTGHRPFIDLSSDGTLGNSGIVVSADDVSLIGPRVSTSAPLTIGSDHAATTAKTAQKLESGTGSFTVDAAGQITLPCTLGVVPVTALTSFQNSQHYGAPDLNTATATAVKVFMRNITVAGSPLLAAGTVTTCRYFYTT